MEEVLGSVPLTDLDQGALQRVVDVMRQFLGFPTFSMSAMMMGRA